MKDLFFQIVRVILILLFSPVLLLAIVLSGLGRIGDFLADWMEDLGHAMSTALKPQAWSKLLDLTQENKSLKFRLKLAENQLAELENIKESGK